MIVQRIKDQDLMTWEQCDMKVKLQGGIREG